MSDMVQSRHHSHAAANAHVREGRGDIGDQVVGLYDYGLPQERRA